MIQRIQTIFLFLTVLVFASLFIVPFAISDRPSVQFLSDGVYEVTDHIVLTVLTIAGILIAGISIFMFRKRKVQLRLGYVIIVIAILLPVVAFLLFTKASSDADANVLIEDQVGLFFPVLAIIFAVVANRFIKKDDRLVKSMDRLR